MTARHSPQAMALWEQELHAWVDAHRPGPSCTCPVWWHCPCDQCVTRLLADTNLADADAAQKHHSPPQGRAVDAP